MNETMTRYGRKPTPTEKINKRLLVWVAPSTYDALLAEARRAGFQSLGQYVREGKLTASGRTLLGEESKSNG